MTTGSMIRVVAIVSLGLGANVPAVLASAAAPAAESRQASKPHRLIVLSDIEADPDDTQSMVRLLLYSDVIDIQGLIATTSTHKRTSVAPESIQTVIRAYSKVHANLVKHDPNYPLAKPSRRSSSAAGLNTAWVEWAPERTRKGPNGSFGC